MRGLILSLAVVFLGNVARGEVVFNNLATGTPNALTFDPGSWFAVKFSATEGFNGFQSIQLNLFKSGSEAGTYSVFLYGNSGATPSTPGSVIGTALATGNISSLNTSTTSPATFSNITLGSVQNAGDYWIAVQSVGNGANDLNWSYGPTTAANLNAISANGTSWTLRSGTNVFGGYIATTSVPEPGTLLLGGIAAACGCGGALWRRKRNLTIEGDKGVANVSA